MFITILATLNVNKAYLLKKTFALVSSMQLLNGALIIKIHNLLTHSAGFISFSYYSVGQYGLCLNDAPTTYENAYFLCFCLSSRPEPPKTLMKTKALEISFERRAEKALFLVWIGENRGF